jgi:hemolysin III
MPATAITPFVFRNPVSAATHLFWCLWACFFTLLLWKLARGDRGRQISVATFGLSMVLLFGASGAYHAVRAQESTLRYFRLADHSAIFVLIAGTYTPIFALLLRGRSRVGMLVVMWGLAAAGIASKWLMAAPPYAVTVGLYVAMGWFGLLPVGHLRRALGWRGLGWGLLGSGLYTLGGVADVVGWPVVWPHVFGTHELLHVLDMAASLAHVWFIVAYVLPYRPPAPCEAPEPALALAPVAG